MGFLAPVAGAIGGLFGGGVGTGAAILGGGAGMALGSSMGGSGDTGGSIQQVPRLTPEQEQLVAILSGKAGKAVRGVGGATIPGLGFAPAGASPLQEQGFRMAGQDISQLMAPVGKFGLDMFTQGIVPTVMSALGGENMARSSGAPEILGRHGRNLVSQLAAQFAPMQFQQPGMMGALGAQQRGIGEAGREFGLQRYMAGAPEADPRLRFIGPAFTQAYDTAVQQGYYKPSIGSQLLGFGGSLLGGMAMRS